MVTTSQDFNWQAGELFGKYRLVRRIAAGGMAEIFLASLSGPSGFAKPCVIKRILPEFSRSPEFCQMLIQEAKIVALLNHPNIVQIYDFGHVGEHYFLCLEFVDGASLHQVIRKAAQMGSALGVRIATTIGINMCAGLAYAHDLHNPKGDFLNLVHRDVTPGNILVSRTGQVKLTDFGIVKVADSENRTNAGVIKGKFAYMSPEQVAAEELDRRSDVFSLGVVLYEVALGRRLFRRKEPAAELMAVAKGEIPPPREVDPNFPEELEKILLKALARDREDRYQTAEDMQRDLESFQASQNWTNAGKQLASLMEQLFPPGEEDDMANLYEAVEHSGSHRTPISMATPSIYTPPPVQAPSAGTSPGMIAGLTLAVCTMLTGLLWLWIYVTGD